MLKEELPRWRAGSKTARATPTFFRILVVSTLTCVLLFGNSAHRHRKERRGKIRAALSWEADNGGCLWLPSVTQSPVSEEAPSPEELQGCEDDLVRNGDFGGCLWEDTKLDVVWTWVNGTDERLAAVRAEARRAGGEADQVDGSTVEEIARHFRDHDELRFSLRSAWRSLSSSGGFGTAHLIVADTPPEVGEVQRCAQVPRWLNLSRAGLAPTGDPRLVVHPHSMLFNDPLLSASTPSFNSLAIEGRFAHIPGLSDTFVFMNDDFFLTSDLTVADFYSPLTGPIFRFQRHDLVHGRPLSEFHHADPDRGGDSDYATGEWKGLELANGLLDARFGRRPRPYLTHIAKAMRRSILREVEAVWAEELASTARSRFRGQEAVEAQMFFLASHYHVERHREALLWSLIIARSDADNDGLLSHDERLALVQSLRPHRPSIRQRTIPIYRPVRKTLETLAALFAALNVTQRPAATEIVFASADGYAFSDERQTKPMAGRMVPRVIKRWMRRVVIKLRRPQWPLFKVVAGVEEEEEPFCVIRPQCFPVGFWGEEDIAAEVVFKHMSFERPHCGDCVIMALLGHAEEGLEYFLPPPSHTFHSSRPLLIGGATKEWRSANFSLASHFGRRSIIVNALRRYSYAVGDSPFIFEQVKHAISPLRRLVDVSYAREAQMPLLVGEQGEDQNDDTTTAARPPAFLAINDNLADALGVRGRRRVETMMRQFFTRVFNFKSPFEI